MPLSASEDPVRTFKFADVDKAVGGLLKITLPF